MCASLMNYTLSSNYEDTVAAAAAESRALPLVIVHKIITRNDQDLVLNSGRTKTPSFVCSPK